jgi:hypothetical protein
MWSVASSTMRNVVTLRFPFSSGKLRCPLVRTTTTPPGWWWRPLAQVRAELKAAKMSGTIERAVPSRRGYRAVHLAHPRLANTSKILTTTHAILPSRARRATLATLRPPGSTAHRCRERKANAGIYFGGDETIVTSQGNASPRLLTSVPRE